MQEKQNDPNHVCSFPPIMCFRELFASVRLAIYRSLASSASSARCLISIMRFSTIAARSSIWFRSWSISPCRILSFWENTVVVRSASNLNESFWCLSSATLESSLLQFAVSWAFRVFCYMRSEETSSWLVDNLLNSCSRSRFRLASSSQSNFRFSHSLTSCCLSTFISS
mgnify:FL=1